MISLPTAQENPPVIEIAVLVSLATKINVNIGVGAAAQIAAECSD